MAMIFISLSLPFILLLSLLAFCKVQSFKRRKPKVERKTKKEGDHSIFFSFLPEPKTAIPRVSSHAKNPHAFRERQITKVQILSISKLKSYTHKNTKNSCRQRLYKKEEKKKAEIFAIFKEKEKGFFFLEKRERKCEVFFHMGLVENPTLQKIHQNLGTKLKILWKKMKKKVKKMKRKLRFLYLLPIHHHQKIVVRREISGKNYSEVIALIRDKMENNFFSITGRIEQLIQKGGAEWLFSLIP